MKRFVCFLLAFVLILGVVPGAALTAFAASELATSDAGLKFIGAFEGFHSKPYTDVDGSTKIGYGTDCANPSLYPNGIDEAKALELLKDYVEEHVDPAINKWAKQNNVTLTQYQHDAVASLLYNCGGTPTSSCPTLASAIKQQWTGNKMIWAFGLYGTSAGTASKGLINRRMAEANLYLNGKYSSTAPSNYTYVVLDLNGGDVNSVVGRIHCFDSAGYADFMKTPTKSGATFLGWELEDHTPVDMLGKDVAGKTLKAKWLENGKDYLAVSYTINTMQAASRELRNAAKKDAAVSAKVNKNSVFNVTAEYVDSDNVKWVYGSGTGTKDTAKDSGKETVKGWLYLGAPVEENETDDVTYATATVTSSSLNVREYATAADSSKVLATLNNGTVVNILGYKNETTSTGIRCWGKVRINGQYGWINLAYVDLKEVSSNPGVDTSKGVKGFVVNTDVVNIRTGAGTNNARITGLKHGTEVVVYEQKVVNGANWGRITWDNGKKEGWVYMYYIQLGSSNSNSGSGSSSTESAIATGVVNSTTNLNVRKNPKVTATWVTSLPKGTKINIYEKTTTNGVEWGRTDKGWVCMLYVTVTGTNSGSGSSNTTGGSDIQTKPTNFYGTVTSTNLTVRKEATNNSDSLGTLTKGEKIQILGQIEEKTSTGTKVWGKVTYKGQTGWLNLAYVDVTASNESNGSTGEAVNGVIANCVSVNVRSNAGVSNALVKTLASGTSVKVYEQIEKDNAPWGRIDEGWVCMYYVTLSSGTTDSGSGNSSTGTVNGTKPGVISATGIVSSNTDLNVRAGAGLGYAKVNALKKGTSVTIYEQVISDGMIWGKINTGWICMSYVTVQSTSNSGSGVMGTIVKCFNAVNVRSAPGTGNALVGTIMVGSQVEIFEQKLYNGAYWGRVAQGWISMEYVQLSGAVPPVVDDSTKPSTEATESTESTGTTQPAEEDVVIEGAVSFKFAGYATTGVNVRKDASADSGYAGTLNANTNLNFVALKMNGSEIWGRQTEHDMPGWINLSNVTITNINGYVQPKTLDVYATASTSATKLGEVKQNSYLVVNELCLNGTTVWGKIDIDCYADPMDPKNPVGWIILSNLGAKLDLTPETSATDNTSIMVGRTYSNVDVYADYQSSKVVFKLLSGATVYVEKLYADHGTVWAKVSYTYVDEGISNTLTGWFDLNKAYYSWNITVTSTVGMNVRKTCGGDILGQLQANDVVTIVSMMVHSDGTVWGQISGGDFNGGWIDLQHTSAKDLF